ncbi:MAG: ROK family protein [Candidatus Lokiarchaeota archaeon]
MIIERYIAGVDIGGTRLRVALSPITIKEERIKRIIVPTPKESKFSISLTVCNQIRKLMKEYQIEDKNLVGIGIASAGPLDIETGRIFNNANLGFREIPLKDPISKEFPDIPIHLINDCSSAVLGVHYFEASDKEKNNLVYITMSTGIGGGVICNGHLLFGKEGNAAEIGHGILNPNAEVRCNCGAKGCWEAYSSGIGIKKNALKFIREGHYNAEILLEIIHNNIENITAKEVFKAARKGDALSQAVLEQSLYYSKVGIGIVNNYYDCNTILFGGAIMNDKEQIIPILKEQFEKDPIQYTINHPPKFKVTKYIDEIGLFGALVLIKYRLEGNPILSS